jgi:hypothetical protein
LDQSLFVCCCCLVVFFEAKITGNEIGHGHGGGGPQSSR